LTITSPKVALITGGGSGIGLAIATQLAARGWSLAIVGRDQAKLDRARRALGGNVEALVADLADADAAAGVVDRCVARLGRLDALINNAGWSPAATIAQTSVALAREIFEVNAISPCVMISRAWGHFERQHSAQLAGTPVIINISSIATRDPFPILYAYAAAKASVNLLALSAARDGAAIGVRAFSVAPGAVETDLLRTLVSKEHLPTSATLSPETVAAVVIDCIEGRRDQENGTTIYIPSPG
jgi:NAD(P)-dependent dehydrogenase (short-subunit alcohol dehydrogenase family)